MRRACGNTSTAVRRYSAPSDVFFGNLPLFRSASRSTNSICALRLRRSSFAQRCIVDKVFSSMRSANALRAAIARPGYAAIKCKVSRR